jgi:hypothetical protein
MEMLRPCSERADGGGGFGGQVANGHEAGRPRVNLRPFLPPGGLLLPPGGGRGPIDSQPWRTMPATGDRPVPDSEPNAVPDRIAIGRC